MSISLKKNIIYLRYRLNIKNSWLSLKLLFKTTQKINKKNQKKF